MEHWIAEAHVIKLSQVKLDFFFHNHQPQLSNGLQNNYGKTTKKAKYVAAFVLFTQKPLHNIAYTPETRTYL